ncbi:hypothetical protein [Halobacillus massiliensis]|uniref:hypothetical protein n=1 Tax=Halobacillus massiliensis TaxID=1926286 RepID=UPI0009E2052F|nr:hypothetical protein [Halobacillus massiliensis]
MGIDVNINSLNVNGSLSFMILIGYIIGIAFVLNAILRYTPLSTKLKDILVLAAMLVGVVAWVQTTFS